MCNLGWHSGYTNPRPILLPHRIERLSELPLLEHGLLFRRQDPLLLHIARIGLLKHLPVLLLVRLRYFGRVLLESAARIALLSLELLVGSGLGLLVRHEHGLAQLR